MDVFSTAAYEHVVERMGELNGTADAHHTDLLFLKGLMDSPIMKSLVKVSHRPPPYLIKVSHGPPPCGCATTLTSQGTSPQTCAIHSGADFPCVQHTSGGHDCHL